MADFPLSVWLRPVALAPGSPRIAAITHAASTVAEDATNLVAVELVESAFCGDDNASYMRVSNAVREIDATYSARSVDLESRIALGITLAYVMRDNDETSTAAAHATLSAAWLNLPSPVEELTTLAAATLRDRAETSRLRHQAVPPVNVSEQLAALPELPDPGVAVTGEYGQRILRYVANAVTALSSSVDAATQHLANQGSASDEELDLLWWAFSGRSSILGRDWSTLTNVGQMAIAMGIEYEALVTYQQEPTATSQIVTRLLAKRAERQVTLRDSVEGAVAAGISSPVRVDGRRLLPILSCLQEAETLGGRPAWRESVSRWSIVTDSSYPASAMAQQLIRELLLARELGE